MLRLKQSLCDCSPNRDAAAASRRRGFSLLEVMIALGIVAVLALSTGVLAKSALLSGSTQNRGLALSIVTNEIEALRKGGYANLPGSASFADPLVAELPSGTTTLSVTTYNAKTKQVVASVLWWERAGAATSSVSLTTLITEVGGLP